MVKWSLDVAAGIILYFLKVFVYFLVTIPPSYQSEEHNMRVFLKCIVGFSKCVVVEI